MLVCEPKCPPKKCQFEVPVRHLVISRRKSGSFLVISRRKSGSFLAANKLVKNARSTPGFEPRHTASADKTIHEYFLTNEPVRADKNEGAPLGIKTANCQTANCQLPAAGGSGGAGPWVFWRAERAGWCRAAGRPYQAFFFGQDAEPGAGLLVVARSRSDACGAEAGGETEDGGETGASHKTRAAVDV